MTAIVLPAAASAPAGAEPILHHVHGLAFTPDGTALLVPAHESNRGRKVNEARNEHRGMACRSCEVHSEQLYRNSISAWLPLALMLVVCGSAHFLMTRSMAAGQQSEGPQPEQDTQCRLTCGHT